MSSRCWPRRSALSVTLDRQRQLLAALHFVEVSQNHPPKTTTPDPLASDVLKWAKQKAQIIHPTKGRMAFHPYDYQVDLLLDDSPRRLVVKARQIGISQVMALEAVHKAIYQPNATILLVSRNQELAVNLLGYAYNAIAGLTGTIPEQTKANESEIGFANGSRIKSLPANRSTGRGFAASSIMLDEFAFCQYSDEIYRSVSPAVGLGGNLTVFSTPDGRANLFFQLWAGIDGSEWSRHEIPWWKCPEYNPSTLKPDDPESLEWYRRERPKYTAASFASEYECDFQTSGEAVFRHEDIEACATGWMGLQDSQPGRQYVTAWDIGRRQDATVGVTLDVTETVHQVVAFERHLGLPYPAIQAAIDRRSRAYPGRHWVESNGVGDPVIENLETRVTAFTTTAKTKFQAITALALAHENKTFKHGIPQLKLETQLYQIDDSRLITDCVIAAAIAEFEAQGSAATGVSADRQPAMTRQHRGMFR